MRTTLNVLVLVVIASGLGWTDGGLGLVPRAKQVTDYGRTLSLGAADDLCIVIGSRASEPERYAADRLQGLIARRFGVTIPVCPEGEIPAHAKYTILLGRAENHDALNAARVRRGIVLPDYSPGPDAYCIEVLDDEGLILVCGSNDRGAIYGAQTLFKLLRSDGGSLTVPVVFVRDWPSIPWRGRPYTSVEAHLKPGVMDAYLWAGLNFIDVRKGAFGFGPDETLDREQISRCLKEAHRRGMFVFGTVSCGVKPEKFDGAIRTFRRLIDLGVDGLWISFDDPGGGQGTTDLVKRVIDLGREKGFIGRTIATTPPSGSYQTIETDFNREMAHMQGMPEATWFFTRNPCEADVMAARRVGLTGLPAWWHNWPRTDAGFTHGSYGGTSFRRDGKPSYIEIPPLTWGWHSPAYDRIRDAAGNTDTVMMWGGWQPEYTCAVLGIWAWDPARHDFQRTRSAIYDTVYGPGNVAAMVRFDDVLHELKSLFLLPQRAPDPKDNFPPRLKPNADRAHVSALLGEAQKLTSSVADTAPNQTLLSEERLNEQFLDPMRAELEVGAALASLERPEDWWPGHQSRVLSKLRMGDEAAVATLSAEVGPRLERQVAALADALNPQIDMTAYSKFWLARANADLAYWREELKRRGREFTKRLADRVKQGLDIAELTAALDSPPAGGRLLASVSPGELTACEMSSQGRWLTGVYPGNDPVAFVMSFPQHTRSVPGDFCQVTFELPAMPEAENAQLQLHLSDEYDTDVWTGYRFYQLLHGESVVWQEDIALTRRGGREWSNIDISRLTSGGEPVRLTLRLVDKRPVGNYPTTIFIGPIRVVQGLD